jgi:DNA repair ATPase RecN
LTQVLESMARDLATLGREIEQLKAGQEQMARDNANTAEQLKASREQMARVLAKASEQNLRPKMSAPLPRPTATPTRRPVPTP